MKVSKTFRLSEEAVAKLNQQDNATQYIEDLILGTGGFSEPHKPNKQISEMSEKIDAIYKFCTTQTAPPVIVKSKRTKQTILSEITALENQRDEEISASQDPDYTKKLISNYSADINLLWEEYRSIDE